MHGLRISMLASACGLALAACMVGPDYHRPGVETPAAYDYQGADALETEAISWWKQLADPVLDDLIDKSLAQNKDLAVAAAKALPDESEATLPVLRQPRINVRQRIRTQALQ